jgi:predicted dienelactone hydrolase
MVAMDGYLRRGCMRFSVAVLGVLLILARASPIDIGFRQIQVPDPPGKPLTIGIWYPSSSHASSQPLGPFHQDVALNGAIDGAKLPVVFVSHGTGGSLASHYDTALALAQAGFVVVGLTHTGDNYQDQSYAGNRIDLIDRPRQLEQVIRFVLYDWNEHAHIDVRGVGVFGFSLGGFTALVEIGGVPDLGRMIQLCDERPAAPECDFIRQRQGDQLGRITETPVWVHDSRIRAAVIVAPAAAYLFGAGGLKQVTIPVQLWRAAADGQAPDAWNSAVVRSGLPTVPDLHTVSNADHYSFLAPCSDALRQIASSICSDAQGFDRASFHKQFNQEVVTFFSQMLRGRG